MKHRIHGAALICLIVLYAAALFAPVLAPYEVSLQNLKKSYHPPTRLMCKEGGLHVAVYEATPAGYTAIPGVSRPLTWFPSCKPYKLLWVLPLQHKLFGVKSADDVDRVYLLGSDSTGRDVFSRLLYGAQISLSIGFIGILITFTFGFLIGGLSGYFGGKVDFLAMRGVEFLMAIPTFYLLLALRAAIAEHFESGQMYIMIVVILAFIGWSSTARVIRGITCSLRQQPFILAAEAMGQSPLRIVIKHVLPNLTGYLLVAGTLSIPAYILGEAALSFLGLGIQEPTASWGLMLRQAQEDMRIFMLNYWWMLSPGLAIFISVISFNLLGDSLRDSFDPRCHVKKG